MELSRSQKAAVEHYKGPCLCMAGPGSGKTLVLTSRISHLIQTYGVKPENILVVTFTRDAAMSMKQRFTQRCCVHPVPAFGTFHSVFYNILRREGRVSADDIISGRRALSVLSYVVRKCSVTPSGESFYPSLVRTISYYKNCGILDENIFPPDTSTDDIKHIIEVYSSVTGEQGFYDFDDLLLETKRFFSSSPDRLSFWRDRFRFILVDEAQDMNRLQYEIITELAHPLDNLFLVGDDDQAIYGFRGSDPSFLLDFTNDFPDASTIILDCNYRSERQIVLSSLKLISNNRHRFTKNLIPYSSSDGSIELITSENDRKEAETVCEMIDELIEGGTDPHEIAVLYRNRRASAPVLAEMARKGRVRAGSDDFFYNSFVYTDMLSYLRATSPVVCREDFFRVLTHPDRNIGRMGLREEMIDRDSWLALMKKTIVSEEAVSLSHDLDFISRLSPYSAVSYIMKRMGYEKFIRDHTYRNGTDAALVLDHAERIREMSRSCHRISDFIDMLEEKKEAYEKSRDDKRDINGIGFYTFHGSKGLEFDHVFIVGACDGITPSDKIKDEAAYEEERRMFYVAMTRARRHLVLSVCARYGNHSYYPSPFIREALGD